MSKGLDKLQIIRHIYHSEYGEDISMDKDLDIIEKELKKLEEIDYILKDSGLTFDDLQKVCFAYTVLKMRGVDKKLKALEIIKEEFEISFNDKNQTIQFESIEEPYTHIRFSLTREIKDKDKYDLLKEVLL